MIRKYVDTTTIELIRSLREPVEFCDEEGAVLGIFSPLAAEPVASTAPTAQAHPWQGHENLGAELDVFGYEHDID